MKQYIAKEQDGKLLLCKPKIEVGALAKWSTLFNYWNQITEVNLIEEYIKLEGDDERLYIDDCYFKVYEPIGEISPDAYGYVKDGQRFDESEVELWAIVNSISTGYKDMVVLLSKWLNHKYTDNQYTVLCKIKGPCGHFH